MVGTADESLLLRALGGVRIERNGQRVDDRVPAKAVALVMYLADSGEPVSRSSLAGLLWSDVSEDAARRSLRVLLTRARAALGDHLQADRSSIWLTPGYRYDVADIEAGLVPWHGSVGAFLRRLDVPGAPLFEDWLHSRSVGLQKVIGDQVLALGWEAAAEGRYADVVELATEWLDVDPWREDMHCLRLEGLAATSGRSAALVAHDEWAARLSADLGVEPEEGTTTFVENLRSRSENPRPSAFLYRTRLIGRENELERLRSSVTPGRPVVILGPGGIGKTRLLDAFLTMRASEGATVLRASFQGVSALSGDDSVRVFAETLLAELRVPVPANSEAITTLVERLADQELTLGIDNVEQLSDIERAIAMLASSCPEAEIVVTSRRRMNLVTALNLDIDGLSTDRREDDLSEAAELFVDRAQLALDAGSDREHVEAVCDALAGHPLAIELAAQWARTVPIEQIATVRAEALFGSGAAEDLDERHRNLDGIVGTTIETVSAGARSLLKAASLFSGPFSAMDLAALVNVDVVELNELTDNCLVAFDGRSYRLHPLIRSYVRGQLDSSPRHEALEEAHAQVMLSVLAGLAAPGLLDPSFHDRSEDLRTAVEWAAENLDVDELFAALRLYLGHLGAWGRAEEANRILTAVSQRGDLTPVDRAELHRHRADLMTDAGLVEEAIAELEQGLGYVGSITPRHSVARTIWTAGTLATLPFGRLRSLSSTASASATERSRLMSSLGELYYVSDRREEMISYGVGALAAGRISRAPQLLAAGDAALAIAWQLGGRHRSSQRYVRRAHEQLNSTELDDYTSAETAAILALVAAGAGRFEEAGDGCNSAVAAGIRGGRMRFVAQVAILHALVDHHRGDPAAALDRLRKVDALLGRIGFARGMTWAQAARAEAALAAGDVGLARESAEAAHASAELVRSAADVARAHVALARVALADGDLLRSARLLTEASGPLATDTALAFHYTDAHREATTLADHLEHNGAVDVDTAAWLRRYRRVAKSFPFLDTQWRGAIVG